MRQIFAHLLSATALTLLPAGLTTAQSDAAVLDWPATVATAQGQTVYFNAWGGDEGINAYIEWVGDQVAEAYGLELVHVKLSDTASAVQAIESEFAAGRTTSDGSVDLLWVNGENFARLKRQGFLGDGLLDQLPNYALTDHEDKITLTQDFSESVDGLESPWGLAQFTTLYDASLMDTAPGSAAGLLAWAQENEGRYAYPAPPNFVGTTFLKQIALELVADSSALYAPAPESQAAADEILAPVWTYLEALHPSLWRGGQAFPDSHIGLRDLFNRDEIDLILTFNPGDATALPAQGVLPDTIAAAGWDTGAIGNAHYVTIPGNASAREGASVVANFLLSPAAQARKADPAIWGDPTVLDLGKLGAADAALFADNTPVLGASVLEPHASWVSVLEAGWAARVAP